MTPAHNPSLTLARLTLEYHHGLSVARAAAVALGKRQAVSAIDALTAGQSLAHFAARNAVRDAERAERFSTEIAA